jgi:hypothetical protein
MKGLFGASQVLNAESPAWSRFAVMIQESGRVCTVMAL